MSPYPAHKSGPHDGPAEWAAILVDNQGKELDRDAPLCHAHARYEQHWREQLGALAKVRIVHLDDLTGAAAATANLPG